MNGHDTYFDRRFETRFEALLPLPFFHSCDARYLEMILDCNAIRPMPCKVYDEDLVYLFYGKPAFKSSNTFNSKMNFLMPLCFMIHYDFVTDIRRAMPFDSGAYGKHLYQDHLHASMRLSEFQLTPTKDTLRKMVHFFYGANEKYYEGAPKGQIEFDHILEQIRSLLIKNSMMHDC